MNIPMNEGDRFEAGATGGVAAMNSGSCNAVFLEQSNAKFRSKTPVSGRCYPAIQVLKAAYVGVTTVVDDEM